MGALSSFSCGPPRTSRHLSECLAIARWAMAQLCCGRTSAWQSHRMMRTPSTVDLCGTSRQRLLPTCLNRYVPSSAVVSRVHSCLLVPSQVLCSSSVPFTTVSATGSRHLPLLRTLARNCPVVPMSSSVQFWREAPLHARCSIAAPSSNSLASCTTLRQCPEFCGVRVVAEVEENGNARIETVVSASQPTQTTKRRVVRSFMHLLRGRRSVASECFKRSAGGKFPL